MVHSETLNVLRRQGVCAGNLTVHLSRNPTAGSAFVTVYSQGIVRQAKDSFLQERHVR